MGKPKYEGIPYTPRRGKQYFAEYMTVRSGERQRRLRRFFSKADRDFFVSIQGQKVDARRIELRELVARIRGDVDGPDDVQIP